MTRRLTAKTMPEFFEKRYASRKLKLISSIIIFIFLIPYSASVYQGLSYLFEEVFGINFILCVLLLACLTSLYLFFGGYFATALSDFIQGIIMLIGVVIMVISVLNYQSINWSEGFNNLINNHLGIFPSSSANVPFIYDKPFTLISLVLLTSLGVWALPQTIHKFYAIRDKKSIGQATVISTIFALIIGIGAYLTGAFGSVFFNGTVPNGNVDTIIPVMLSTVLLPGFIGLIAVLVLSASMSTLSSVALSGSSVIAVDVYKGFINKKATDKKTNFVMRIFCLIFIAISVLLAIFPIDAIVTMMGISWGTLAGCFIGPFVLGLLSKKITKAAAWSSIISGLVITLTLVLVFGFDKGATNLGAALKTGVSMSPTIGVITMVWSLIITPIVSIFTKKPDKEIIYNSFNAPLEDEII
jgi:SSS family solute:Na+ symporter/sodium/proline symporter